MALKRYGKQSEVRLIMMRTYALRMAGHLANVPGCGRGQLKITYAVVVTHIIDYGLATMLCSGLSASCQAIVSAERKEVIEKEARAAKAARSDCCIFSRRVGFVIALKAGKIYYRRYAVAQFVHRRTLLAFFKSHVHFKPIIYLDMTRYS